MNVLPLSANVLTAPAADTSSADRKTKLLEAAKQFEALMISEMMKSVHDSGGGWFNDGGETGEDSATGMAEEQFAQAMAHNGGLGLAHTIVAKMEPALDRTLPSAVPDAIAKP